MERWPPTHSLLVTQFSANLKQLQNRDFWTSNRSKPTILLTRTKCSCSDNHLPIGYFFRILQPNRRNFLNRFSSVFSWAGRVPIEKTASVRLKPYLYTFIWPFKIFGVKTLMGVEWFEVHFLAIFWVDHKVFTCCPKNHERFTWRHLYENFC